LLGAIIGLGLFFLLFIFLGRLVFEFVRVSSLYSLDVIEAFALENLPCGAPENTRRAKRCHIQLMRTQETFCDRFSGAAVSRRFFLDDFGFVEGGLTHFLSKFS